MKETHKLTILMMILIKILSKDLKSNLFIKIHFKKTLSVSSKKLQIKLPLIHIKRLIILKIILQIILETTVVPILMKINKKL
jgi:hypothetical protein